MYRSSPESEDGLQLHLGLGLGMTSSSIDSQLLQTRDTVARGNFVSKYPLPIKVATGSGLNAIAALPGLHNSELLLVGGREILKIYSTGQDGQEILNLKLGVKSSLNHSSNHVAWGNMLLKNCVASASLSGMIVLFDLNRPEKLDRVLSEHLRAVHRIVFHNADPFILSASQDGTMKLWDLRSGGTAKLTFDGKAESARDVQFNPGSSFEFASVFDNGCLQIWDIRNPNHYERKWSAHNGLALAVDWNLKGTMLATGGRDRVIKIWDVQSKQRKPHATIQAIASVSRLKWRPGSDTQIAACSLSNDFRIHIWDTSKPHMPAVCLDQHENIVTDILWKNPDTLWSCSKDESFVQSSIRDGYNPSSLLNSSSVNWDPLDNLGFCTVKRESNSYNWKSQKAGIIIPIQNPPHSSFAFLAHYYVCDPDNIGGTCDTNAALAETVEMDDIAKTWRLIKLLYCSKGGSGRNLTEVFQRIHIHAASRQNIVFSLYKDMFSGGLKAEDNALPFPTFVNSAVAHGINDILSNDTTSDDSDTETPSKSPFLSLDKKSTAKPGDRFSPSVSTLDDSLDAEEIIYALLDYYAELGDPQTATFIVMLLGDVIQFPSNLVQQYTQCYLDLLHRFQLWPESTLLINSSKEKSINTLNGESTTIHKCCASCSAPVSLVAKSPGHCENCKLPISLCSFCHEVVIGLYTWCQWCSHGGHLSCLDEWFLEHSECPTGCGHSCSE